MQKEKEELENRNDRIRKSIMKSSKKYDDEDEVEVESNKNHPEIKPF